MNMVRGAGGTVKAATLQHILDHVEMFSADGAANEQLAGRLLHPLVQRSAQAVGKLKNLKMVLRDKAHAARRLTLRTFNVDPKLAALQKIMLSDTPSIAKMLRYSRPCREVFEQALATQRPIQGAESAPGGAAGPTHMGYAKQRFDNAARPLGICVWDLDAVIRTCDVIWHDTSFDNKWRKLCQAFLAELDEEMVLLLGRMADASGEVLMLVRFFDREEFAIEHMAERVQ